MAAPLLTTKLYIPPVRPGLVPRPHLVERLNKGLSCKLTLISAPAGFGKTTLLSEWISQSQRCVSWVSLDEGDNDLTRFWSYFIAGVQRLNASLAENTLLLLQSPQPPSLETSLTTLLNELATFPEPFALVLDDYHVIENPALQSSISFLLDHLPPQVHLIMIGRADPPLSLARLRGRGQLNEVRAADLRFTPQETTLFLNQVMGLNLSVQQVEALETRTEGWIAGLQLAALAMQNRTDLDSFVNAFTGSNRFVVDYLAAEVFASQPAHIQTFLLQTSILDRMCGSLCDAVTGISEASPGNSQRKIGADTYSQILLEALERANLFIIPLDNERSWYRYHHLFAEVMRARLASGALAETVVTLHRRASAWYEAEGLVDEAIRHALAAPDAELAAALVERYSLATLLRSEIFLIRTWLEQLPPALVQTRPRLILARGWTLILTGHHQAAEQWLAASPARQALQQPDLPADVVGELLVLRATIARFQRDPVLVQKLAQQALNCIPEDRRGLRAGATFTIGLAQLLQGEIGAASQTLAEAASIGETAEGPYIAISALEELAAIQIRQGRLSQAMQTCYRVVRLVARWGGRPIPAAGMVYIYIGEILYEQNDLAGARQALTYGIDLLRGSIEQALLAQGYIALGRIQQVHGDLEGAFAAIQRGEDWLVQMQIDVSETSASALLALGKARLWLKQDQLATANRWAQTYRWWDEGTKLGYLQRLALVRLRLAQSRHDPQGPFLAEASEVLSPLLARAEASGWGGHLIEGLILQALLYQAQGDFTGALAALERALTLAEPEGYLRIFVDEGEPMAELLSRWKTAPPLTNGSDRLNDYVHKLFSLLEKEEDKAREDEPPLLVRPSTLKVQPLVDPLSLREQELLRLVAAGNTNQEIAQELFLAVGTVKKHLNNIFGKLAVGNRTQAIARARELGIVD